jgi:hypothetical protein
MLKVTTPTDREIEMTRVFDVGGAYRYVLAELLGTLGSEVRA